MKTYYFDRLSCSIKFNIRYFYRSLIRNLFFKVLKAKCKNHYLDRKTIVCQKKKNTSNF